MMSSEGVQWGIKIINSYYFFEIPSIAEKVFNPLSAFVLSKYKAVSQYRVKISYFLVGDAEGSNAGTSGPDMSW